MQSKQKGRNTGSSNWKRLAVCDGVAFAYSRLSKRDRELKLDDLLRTHVPLESRPSRLPDDFAMRIFVWTIERWIDALRKLMRPVWETDDPRAVPKEGIVQYFSDDLAFCVYLHYAVENHQVTFKHVSLFSHHC